MPDPIVPAPAPAPAAPVETLKPAEKPADAPKVEPKVDEIPAAAAPKKDAKALAAEQERRLEIRATAIRSDLAKRERSINERIAELDKRESSVKELLALKDAKASAKDDPISFLEANGLTFEDVAKAAASGNGADPAARKALKEARELRAKLEDREKQDSEAQKKAEAAKADTQKKTTLATIDSMLKSDKKYKYAAEFGSPEDVFDAWFSRYQKTGKMPDVHDVAAKVNEFYRNQAERAHKAWSEELAATAAKPVPATAAEPVEKKVEKKDVVAEVVAPLRDDASLRGRTRGQGSRSYQNEVLKQLEEVRKSRAS